MNYTIDHNSESMLVTITYITKKDDIFLSLFIY